MQVRTKTGPRRLKTLGRAALVAVILTLALAAPTLAASPITLDGQFGDWTGQMHLDDPTGDVSDHTVDITAFYWANNPNDTTCYWMMERVSDSDKVYYLVYIDADNDGRFDEHVDRLVQVSYEPRNNNSRVGVIVRYADTSHIISSVSNKDWGESTREGGRRVEFKANFADLGINVHQTIRMYAISYVERDGFADSSGEAESSDTWTCPGSSDRVPDAGDIQWSPVPITGYWLVFAAPVLVAAVLYLGKRFKWFQR